MNTPIPFPPRREKPAICWDRRKIAANRIVPILGFFCALSAWVFYSNPVQGAPDSAGQSGVQLTIELRDGSRVVGKSAEDTLSFHSATLGDMKLAWAGIHSIEYAAGGASSVIQPGTARLTATNGDGFTIQVNGAENLRVETGFGQTDLPVKLIRSVKVSLPAKPAAAAAPAAPSEASLRLTIELRDGSHIVGKGLEDTLSFHTAAMGDLKLTWAAIRSIEYTGASTDMARLAATNGDVYVVQFAAQSLGVETSFGKTELPVKLIRSVKVSGGSSPGGLIGWWKLDDGSGTVARDSSPNHHDGQLASGPARGVRSVMIQDGRPTPDILPPGNYFDDGGRGPVGSLPVWTQGKNGGALQFNGVGQYVSLGKILEDGYAELTIACWVKHPRTSWQHIVERSDWDNLDGLGLMMDYSGGSVDFGHYAQHAMSRTVVQDNQWHHVAGTLSRDGADYVYSIFVDGKLDNAVTNSVGFTPSSNGWGVGARYNGTWSYQGLIEDVRIYDRALKEDEVKQIYEGRN